MFIFNTVVIASHRRAGLQLAVPALGKNCPDINATVMDLEQLQAGHDSEMKLALFRRQLLNLPGKVIVTLHDLPSGSAWAGLDERQFARTVLRHSPIVYMHRDGRDVMASLYFHMQTISERVRGQDFATFLRADLPWPGQSQAISRPAYWARHAEAWLKQEHLLAIGYWELEQNFEATLQRMASFAQVELRQPLPYKPAPPARPTPAPLQRVISRLGLLQRRGYQPQIGKTGDWRSLFSRQDEAFFMREAGQTMRRLGYGR